MVNEAATNVFLKSLAPAEAAEAATASLVLIRAFQHQADTYDAVAKKLRQEADRQEREQKKKN